MSVIDDFMREHVKPLTDRAEALGINALVVVGAYDPKRQITQSNYMCAGCYHASIGLAVEVQDKLRHPEDY